MKTNRVSRLLFALALASIFIATWSCNEDEGPSLQSLREDRLKFIEDSLRISDSLRLTNNAGIVNYGVTVVDGSTSSIYANGRTEATKSALEGAIVTISQYGKVVKDTTDASGIAVFNGFFRSAVNITVEVPGFTKVSYIAAVNIQDSTRTGTISFVGNIIPVFATTGTGTATITGRATIQTDLRNKSRELAPDGTVVTANIDASNGSDFSDKFLTTDIDEFKYTSGCGCEFIYVGNILQASYQTEARGTVSGGDYTIAVPAAIDGLPLIINYSDVAADQTLFVEDGDPNYSDNTPGDRTVSVRTLFGPEIAADAIPSGSTVSIGFVSFTTAATATAVVSTTSGTLDRINVTSSGSGYSGTPLIEITDIGGTGTGAAATATVVDGRVTNITLTNPGSGYTNPSITLLSGTGSTASATNLGQDGTVTSVVITDSGSGYVTAPTVIISAPTGTGLTAPVTATGTATIVNGRVTGVTITNAGAAYIANPTITFSAPPAGGVQATATAFYSGQSVSDVQITNPGINYSYAPRVTFSAPFGATGGIRATGTALINPITRQVTGINITNPGMGYTAAPTVTLSAVTVPATTEVFLTGGSVLSADIISQGSGYAYAPTVVFTGGGGTGATGTAVLVDGKVVGINITNGGVGYTSAPTIAFNTGANASAFATVTNGAITAITVTDGGFGFAGAPRITIGSSVGGGATATATVNAEGAVTGITVTTGGTGYLEGNSPSGAGVGFNATKGINGDGASEFEVKPGISYINDIYYGTGNKQENN